MSKEKFHIEFIFDKASKNSLWEYISTSAGLAEWFADTVDVDGKLYVFKWNNHIHEAELISIIPNNSIRFHWLDDENQDTFFEFHLHKIEITGGLSLVITDFTDKHEKESAIALWETQVKTLKRVLGL